MRLRVELDVPELLRYLFLRVSKPFSIFRLPLQNLAEIIEEELEAEAEDPCNGRTCTMNEQCCNGHVCVDTEDSEYFDPLEFLELFNE